MNLTTGTGRIAWQPQRLSAEAYALSPADSPSEVLPSTDRTLNVLEGMFPYGPIGACRTGGTCVLSRMPAGWDAAPYPRLMRFKLESELGTGYVYSAIVKEVRKDGRRALIDLMSVQDKYAQAAMISGGGLLTFPPLVSTQRLLTGKGGPLTYGPHQIREEVWRDYLADQLNSEWGVGPDLVGAAGRPESATSLDYVRDYRAGNPQPQGFVIPDYATGWVFDPGEGWEKTSGVRGDVPVWAPLRTVSAGADPATLSAPQTTPLIWQANYPAAPVGQSATYQATPSGDVQAKWTANFFVPAPTPQARYSDAKVELRINVQSVIPVDWGGTPSANGHAAYFQLAVYGPGGMRVVQYLDMPAGFSGLMVQPLDLPTDLIGQLLEVSVLLVLGQKSHAVTMTLEGGSVTAQREVPNVGGIVVPREFYYPYSAGPAHQFNLRAWVAPPVRVLNLPGGQTQYLAQSEVHWTDKGATSLLTTAAMPWR